MSDKAETLAVFVSKPTKEPFSQFRFTLPYTLNKAQKSWANLIEQGRFSAQANETVQNFFASSPEAKVKADLERELGRGLRTWQAIFKEKGYIPTGLGAGGMGGGYAWDDMSDAGGYAHLLSAASQWLLHLEGKRDWEVHGLPRPAL